MSRRTNGLPLIGQAAFHDIRGAGAVDEERNEEVLDTHQMHAMQVQVNEFPDAGQG